MPEGKDCEDFMKKLLLAICVLALSVSCLFACDDDHTHSYTNGQCSCGEKDPSYVPPHVHSFVEGVCSCGAEDPDYIPPHEHKYVDGKCETCAITDPDYKPSYGDATVFVPGDKVQIVTDTPAADMLASHIIDSLDPIVVKGDKGGTVLASIYHMPIDKEIIIGYVDPDRPVTLKAEAALEKIEKESYFEARYVVYSENNCLAIIYDINEYTNINVPEVIYEEILDVLFKSDSYLALPSGVVLSGTVDLIAAQEEIDLVELQGAWSRLEAVVGKATADAFRTLYTMYDEDLAEWVANLYDPGTGGFYASSGGRDGAEFGPDVQCTVQLLRFIESSGMVKNLPSGSSNYIPMFMQQQMVYFAKSLQDPSNGHFYHPQWGKALTDTHLSRRGRDLGWATDLLATFNSAPTFRAPNGKVGDGITADEYWQRLVDNGEALGPKPYPSTESPTLESLKDKMNGASLTSSLVTNAAYEVSKIILASSNPEDVEIDSSTAYLATHLNFIDYLLVTVAPGMDSNPYSMGNNLNATYSQIKDASNEIGAYTYQEGDELKSTNPSGALQQFKVNKDADTANDLTLKEIYQLFDGMNLKEMTIFVLNEKINPKIGLWGEIKPSKPNGTEFYYTNGFFKVITLYNSWGFQYPAEYIDDAANALMDGLMGDEESKGNICEVYNVWSAISTLRSNLTFHKDAELKARIEAEISAILSEKSAAAVLNTYTKIKGYQKYDGGFAHSYNNGTGSHQGLPVGHAELNQSDVDATCIGSTGLTRAIFQALGILEYKIPLLMESDWMNMLEIFIAQDPVIKYSYDGETVYTYAHDFESDVPESAYFKYNTGIAENTFTQMVLNGQGVGFLNKAQAGKQSYLDFKINDTVTISNTVIYESKIMFKDIKEASEAIELRFYDGTNADKRIYTLYIYASSKTEGSPVYVAPKSDKNNRVEIGKIGEWFTLKLAYHNGDIGSTTAPSVFKVYANGSETPIIVDEKFESGDAINAKSVGFARFLTMSSFSGKIYVDDIRFAHENVDYVYHAPTHNTGSAGGGSSTPVTPPPSDYKGLPTTPEGTVSPTTDGKLTFDNITAFPVKGDNGLIFEDQRQYPAWKGYITTVTEDGNSFIRVVDPVSTSEKVEGGDSGQCIFLIDRPDYTGTDTTFVFEGKFRISALEDGAIKDGMYMFDVTLRNSAGTRVYRNYFGSGKVTVNGSDGDVAGSVFKTGEWFTLRVEYTVVGSTAEDASWNVKIFINDTLAVSSDAPTTEKNVFANSLGIDKVGILVSREFVGNLDIDDIKMYQKAAE